MNDNLIINLYMYELYKSKYLEENKDKELNQDEVSRKLDTNKLLYMFNDDLPKGSYLDIIKKFGTEVKIDGYSYNLNRIATVISNITGGIKVSYKNLVITNNEIIGDKKSITVFNSLDCKTYKLNISSKNSAIIIPKKFNAYGINMLCIDEAEHISIEDEFLMSSVWEIINKNGGYITDRNKLCLFNKYLDKKFIRKWDKENIMVSVCIEDYFEYDDYYYGNFSNEFLDGEDF